MTDNADVGNDVGKTGVSRSPSPSPTMGLPWPRQGCEYSSGLSQLSGIGVTLLCPSRGCRINCLESKGKTRRKEKKRGSERREKGIGQVIFLVFNQFCFHHKKIFSCLNHNPVFISILPSLIRVLVTLCQECCLQGLDANAVVRWLNGGTAAQGLIAARACVGP